MSLSSFTNLPPPWAFRFVKERPLSKKGLSEFWLMKQNIPSQNPGVTAELITKECCDGLTHQIRGAPSELVTKFVARQPEKVLQKRIHKEEPNIPHTLQLPREGANPSSTTDESRVQLISLEYDEFRLARRLASVRIENATEATRSTYSGKRRGPKGLSESLKCCRYTRLIKPCIPSDAALLGKVHHWRPCPPAVEIISNCGGRVFCHSAHTHAPPRGAYILFCFRKITCSTP